MNDEKVMSTILINLSTFDLQAQFELCEQWNDPSQWEALAMLYYRRGYYLNACRCFERADMCSMPVAEETGVLHA